MEFEMFKTALRIVVLLLCMPFVNATEYCVVVSKGIYADSDWKPVVDVLERRKLEDESTALTLSTPFDTNRKRTQQMSYPGTKEEKRTFYRSKGNPYYKVYEPAKNYGSSSRSVGSYSTWATNEQDILVSVAAETAYVRRGNQKNTLMAITQSESSDSTAIEDIIARCQRKLRVQNQI